MRDGDYLIDELTGCWVWQKALNNGYGTTYHGKIWSAHRWYYTQLKGPIPRGYWIDHLCRNKACVNPEHLEAVTPSENTLRARADSRAQRQNRPLTPRVPQPQGVRDSSRLRQEG